jgi:hypothetical protein
MRRKPEAARLPWAPPDWDLPDLAAVQALIRGDASPEQQQRFVAYLVNDICKTYDLSFRPEDAGGTRGTDFHEGRRFVGLMVVKMSRLNASAFRKNPELGPEPT